ncbi:MAG: protein kinase [Planctomycetota bacterium]
MAAASGSSTGVETANRSLPANAPRQVGRFVVVSKLGEGAFGEVYLARDPHLERDVALKLAKPEMLSSPERVERFLREARSAAGLQHPNIVAVYDAGQEDGRYYIAAAFIPGRTLEAELKSARATPERVARWTRQLAEALAYAHGRGIVHRDVKPANVMLNERDEPMLMDFGLARRHDDEHARTQDGKILGTPQYMSPEQARGDMKAVGPASDQYSLGVMLYEMLTGRPPFSGTVELVLFHHCETDAARPRYFDRRIPRDLETICLKCLEKAPSSRYAGCQFLADDLHRQMQGDAVRARRIGYAERLARWSKKNRATSVLTVAIFVILLVATGLGWRNVVEQRSINDQLKSEMTAKEAERLRNSRFEYVNLVRGSQKLIRESRPGDASRLLDIATDRIAPSAPGLEWHLLKKLADYPGTVLHAHPDRTNVSAYSPDGKTFATAGVGKATTIVLWDAGTSAPIGNLPGHEGELRSLQYNRSGTSICSIDDHGTVCVWDAASKKLLASSRGPGPGFRVCWLGDPANSERVIAARGANVEFLDMPDLTVSAMQSFGSEVRALAVSPDGQLVACCGADGDLVFSDVKGNQIARHKRKGEALADLSFSGDGKRLVGVTATSWLVWSMPEQTLKAEFPIRNGTGQNVRVLPDNKRFASVLHDHTSALEVYDLETGRLEFLLSDRRMKPRWVWQFAISPDAGSAVVPGDEEGAVMRFDLAWPPRQQKKIKAHALGLKALCLSISDDAKRIVTGGEDLFVHLWDAETNARIRSFGPHFGSIYDLVISSDNRLLATCDDWRTIRIFELATGKQIASLNGGHKRITRLAFTRDNSHLLTAGWDGTCRLWNVGSGKEQASDEHGSKIFGLALHPQQPVCLIASEDGKLRAWNFESNETVWTTRTNINGTRDLQFDANGTRLFCADIEGTIFMLDPNGVDSPVPMIDRGGTRFAIAPDGKSMATASRDGTVRILDVASKTEIFAAETGSPVRAVSYAANSLAIAAVCEDGSLQIWAKKDPAELFHTLQSKYTYREARP